ncbi:MAG: hypothetical protein EXS03_04345 [Phycisphaerales bacterium]|nr:hypothetical protein [Phycisphaerales bacterium]
MKPRCHLLLASALSVLAATSVDAAVIHVAQSGANFVPPVVNANVGDTIHWMWSGQGHTVTSGSNCTADGLFDGDLSSSSTSFAWVVPASVAGTTVDYFCMPHCLFFMEGSINVAAPTWPPGDINHDNLVNGLDITQLMSAWGTSDAAADINDDGAVDAIDLSVILSNWTS